MLMTGSWQPSVLQLTPFGSNDASSQNDVLYHEERLAINRSFPRLAVTRVHNFSVANKSIRFKVARSASECENRSRQQFQRPTSLPGSRLKSECNTRTKANKDGVFSVKDLNDQIIYSANTDIYIRKNSEGSAKKSWLSSSNSDFADTVKYLPKPNVSRSLDGRYFLPQNGFWRAVTLTPGEIDLRKQKVYQDSKQKKSLPKNKVNINSLPRSNTPITDYDPDKLNMKNVVAFLQKNNCEVKFNSPRSSVDKSHSTQESELESVLNSEDAIEKVQKRNPKKNRLSHRMRISEQVPTMEQRFKKPENDYKHSKDNSTRSVRQFRLHRFLKMATQDLPTNNPVESKTYSVLNPSELSQSPMKIKQRNLNQNNNGFTSHDSSAEVKSPASDKVSIRLPHMSEELHDAEEDLKSESVDLLDAIETVANAQKPEVNSNSVISNGCVRKSNFTSSNSKLFKKFQITLPEHRAQPVNDKVKLSLRRERHLTREHTYMSDLANSGSDGEHRKSSTSSLRNEICSFSDE